MAYNLDMTRIPEHVAIIMDGNGRWATERGKVRSYGHQAGVDAVRRITSELFMKNDVKVRVIGDFDRLPKNVQDKLNGLMELTANNKTMTMIVALSYSSRWEITKTVKDIAREVAEGKIKIEDICESTISEHQIAYSELYFCDTYWPDFSEEDLHKAIATYQKKQRRFGLTEEQVENKENEKKEE